MYLQKAAVVNS